MENLKRIEDLTRRYSKARIGGAGLCALWALIMVAALMVLVCNHIYTEFLASGNTYPSLWRFLSSDILVTPFWLKAAAIGTSIFTWFGITCIQFFVDRRLGVAVYHDPTSMLMRILIPGLFLVFMLFTFGFDVGKALAIRDNTGKSIIETMDISSHLGWVIITAWGVVWAFTTRDSSSRAIAIILTMMLFPIMSSTLSEVDLIAVIPQLLVLILFAIFGLRQFTEFMKVRNEINALSVST